MHGEVPKTQRLISVAQAFRPAAPVDVLELFAGREVQRQEVVAAVSQTGYHVALYGERGVGKTSLARILAVIFDQPEVLQLQTAMVNCNTDDTFGTLWTGIFRRLDREIEDFTPEGVRYEIERLDPPALMVIELPHYTHLLGFRSAERAVQNDRDVVELADVEASLPKALEGHTMQSDYIRAVRSSQPQNLYKEVLLACAFAPKNELGYFTSGQIRDPLEIIVGRRLEIPAFSKHLKEFLDPERGAILQRVGKERNYSYRFPDPMTQPYVIMTSLTQNLITTDQLEELLGDSADSAELEDVSQLPDGSPPQRELF